jgi:hypothetical protein
MSWFHLPYTYHPRVLVGFHIRVVTFFAHSHLSHPSDELETHELDLCGYGYAIHKVRYLVFILNNILISCLKIC